MEHVARKVHDQNEHSTHVNFVNFTNLIQYFKDSIQPSCACSNTVYKIIMLLEKICISHFSFLEYKHYICDYYSQANNCKYFNFMKIPAWLSVIFLVEFAEIMFLLTGDLRIFDKAIAKDPVSQAIGQPKFNVSHLNLT